MVLQEGWRIQINAVAAFFVVFGVCMTNLLHYQSEGYCAH